MREFTSPRARRILKNCHGAFKRAICVTDAFPLPGMTSFSFLCPLSFASMADACCRQPLMSLQPLCMPQDTLSYHLRLCPTSLTSASALRSLALGIARTRHRTRHRAHSASHSASRLLARTSSGSHSHSHNYV